MMNEANIEMNDKKEGKKEEIGSDLSHDWSELNKECLIDILSRLSLEERWKGPMLVCKPWMYACDDPSLNSVFDLETWFEGTQSTRILSLWYSFEFEQKVDSFLRCVVDRSQGGLKEIRVRHCSDQSLSYAAERCPNLEVLCIKNCLGVTDESITKIALSCPNLEVLCVYGCLELTDVSMTKVASNCHKLRELDISQAFNISQKALRLVERSCKNVKIIMEPPSNVRLSQDEARNYGLSVRSIDTRELFEHISQLNTNDS